MATADACEVEALRPVIGAIVASESVFRRLDEAIRRCLVNELVSAVGFAKAGLRDILSGKSTRADAWTMDLFVRDVCEALRTAGVPVLMDPEPEASHAQSLAKRVAAAAGLPDQGELYKQMQRARKIEKNVLSDVLVFTERPPGV